MENLGPFEPAEFHDMMSFIWGTFRGPIWSGLNGGTCGIPCNFGEIKIIHGFDLSIMGRQNHGTHGILVKFVQNLFFVI